MPNTPANDAPYVIGAIEDAGTAQYPGLQHGNDTSGFDAQAMNPVVVNADGSFVAAFAVTAPSKFWNINPIASSGGIVFGGVAAGVVSEIFLPSLIKGSGATIAYTLSGRSAANIPVSLSVTPVNNRIVVTEAMLANFAPGISPALVITGLQPGSNAPMFITGDVTDFYDGAGPTVTAPAIPNTATVGASGSVQFSYLGGLVESFTLQNTAVWTNVNTVFVLSISTSEPLDLTGVTQTINQSNVFGGSGYSTTITIVPDGGVVAVPQTVLQQLQAHPGSVRMTVSGATPGQAAQAAATVELPVTHITEGLYTQHFDAAGNPLGDAVRLDIPANALVEDADDFNFRVSRSADGGLVAAWLGNDDADGAADAVYVVKLDDAGHPAGATVALTGLSAEAATAILGGNGDAALAGLADGGFAVAYTVEAADLGAFVTGTVFGNSATFNYVAGQLDRVDLVQFTASGAISGVLLGTAADGSVLAVPVALVGNSFQMTDALRAQFAPEAHLSLVVQGLTGNTPYAASVQTRDVFDFDASSTLATTTIINTSAPNPSIVPDVFIASNTGQVISYQLNSMTPAAGEAQGYILSVFTTHPISVSGLTVYNGPVAINGILNATANTFVNGYYLTSLVVNPVAGAVAIPASVLAQINGDEISSLLMISGLQAGTSVSATLTYRQASHILQEGVFTQTFDAAGASEGPAQQIDDADASLAVAAGPRSEGSVLAISADADGGFHVSWLAATDGDPALPPRIISREFDADGNAVGTALDVSAADLPDVVEAIAAGGNVTAPSEMHVVELGSGGFAALLQVDAEQINASLSAFGVAPGNGGTGSITFVPLRGQLDSVVLDTSNPVAAALASQPRAGYVSGKGLDGNPLQVAVTITGGRFDMSAAVSSQFLPGEKLSLTVTGVTNPASPNAFSFVFVPAFIGSQDLFTFDATSTTVSISSTVNATNNPTAPSNLDAFFGSGIGRTTGFHINSLTAAAGETPDFVLYVVSEEPINTAGLNIYGGVSAPPLYSNVPNNTLSPNGVFATTITVTPVNGLIEVPASLLAQFPHGGLGVSLYIRGLQGGTPVNVDTIVQQPSHVLDTGLFVQLLDAAGQPNGPLIQIDDPAAPIIAAEDNSKASIQSDGAGGFRVVWASDVDGDGDGDALNIARFDADGHQIGTTLTVDSIPDRIYTEGDAITLYTSGLFADPDPADVLTFSAAGLPDGVTIDPATGVISGASADPGLFAVTVTATDAGGLAASTSFEMYFIDDGAVEVNLAPTAVSFANIVASTPENGGPVKVADIVVADDGQGTNVLTLSGADAASFSIIDGALWFAGGGNFEGLASFDVIVSASDPALPDPAVSADFTLILSDVTEDQSLTLTRFHDDLDLSLSIDNWTIDALQSNDTVLTGGGADDVIGGSGDDFLDVGAGADAVDGGSGDDVIIGGGGGDTLLGGANNDRIFGDDGDDVIDGGSGDDELTGGAGNDTIAGGSGADIIDAGSGGDTVNAGSGDDTIFGGLFDGVSVDQLFGEAGDDKIDGNGVLDGGVGDDTIRGGTGGDTISGGAGDDILSGGGYQQDFAADHIDGGSGDDTIYGETGEDILLGGSGVDNIFGGGENDTINGDSGDDNLDGGEGSDTVSGDAGNDTIYGQFGDDVLNGGNGLDTIYGEWDNDTINGDNGDDTLSGGLGDDTVNGGTGNDDIAGDEGGDTLNGDKGDDTIDGGADNDFINGGAGADLLTGGAGSDTFIFALKTDSRLGILADHITDFDALVDHIDLSAIDASTRLPDDQAFSWIGSAAFSRVAGQLRYEVISGSAHITGDLNGDSKADFEIVLDGVTTLPGTSDFLIL